jgi:hypothetical protein
MIFESMENPIEVQREHVKHDEAVLLARVLGEGGVPPHAIQRQCSEFLGRPVEMGEVRRWLGISRRPS